MLDVGFKNYVDENRVVAIIPSNSSHARWLIKEAIAGRKLINCTHGKKTYSILILNTYHLVLTSLKCTSLSKRLNQVKNKKQINYKVVENPL